MSIFDADVAESFERARQRRRTWLNRGFALGVAAATLIAGIALAPRGGHPPAILLLPVVVVLLSPFAAIGAVAGLKERAAASDHQRLSTLALIVNLTVAMAGIAAVGYTIIGLLTNVIFR